MTGDKFMPELHLKQAGFTYRNCGPFTKHYKKIQKFREAGNLKHLCRNELGKGCFSQDAAYSDSKDLAERTISDRVLKDRAYESARNYGYDGYQRALARMIYNVFDKKTWSGAIATNKAVTSVNEQLAKELHKPVNKKFKRRKVYPRFKENI